jgi:hypothetical protein
MRMMKKFLLILFISAASVLYSSAPTKLNDHDPLSSFAAVRMPIAHVSDAFTKNVFSVIDKTYGPAGIGMDAYQVHHLKKTYLYLIFLTKIEKLKSDQTLRHYMKAFAPYIQDNHSSLPNMPDETLVKSEAWNAVKITAQDIANCAAWQLYCKTLISDIYVYFSMVLEIIHNVEKQTFNYIPHFETSFYNADYTNFRTINEMARTRLVLEDLLKKRLVAQCTDWKTLPGIASLSAMRTQKNVPVSLESQIVAFRASLFYKISHDVQTAVGLDPKTPITNAALISVPALKSPIKELVWCYYLLYEASGQITSCMTAQNLQSVLELGASSELVPNIFAYKPEDYVLLDELLSVKSKAQGTHEESVHPSPAQFKIDEIAKPERIGQTYRDWHTEVATNLAKINQLSKNSQVKAQGLFSFFKDIGHDFSKAYDDVKHSVEAGFDAVKDFSIAVGMGIAGVGAALVGQEQFAQKAFKTEEKEFNKSVSDLNSAVADFADALKDGIVAPMAELNGDIIGFIWQDQKLGADISSVIDSVANTIVDAAAEAGKDIFIYPMEEVTIGVMQTVSVAVDTAVLIGSAVWAIFSKKGQEEFLKAGEDLGKQCVTECAQAYTFVKDVTMENIAVIMKALSVVTNAITSIFIDLTREITYLFTGGIFNMLHLSSIPGLKQASAYSQEQANKVTSTLQAHRAVVNVVIGVVACIAVDVATAGAGTAADAAILGAETTGDAAAVADTVSTTVGVSSLVEAGTEGTAAVVTETATTGSAALTVAEEGTDAAANIADEAGQAADEAGQAGKTVAERAQALAKTVAEKAKSFAKNIAEKAESKVKNFVKGVKTLGKNARDFFESNEDLAQEAEEQLAQKQEALVKAQQELADAAPEAKVAARQAVKAAQAEVKAAEQASKEMQTILKEEKNLGRLERFGKGLKRGLKSVGKGALKALRAALGPVGTIMNVTFNLGSMIGGFNQDAKNVLDLQTQTDTLQRLWAFNNANQLSIAQQQVTYLDEMEQKVQAQVGNQALQLALSQNVVNQNVLSLRASLCSLFAPLYVQYLIPDPSTGLQLANIGTLWNLKTQYVDLYPSQGFFTSSTGRSDFPFAQEIAQDPQMTNLVVGSGKGTEKLWFNQRCSARDLLNDGGTLKKLTDPLVVQIDFKFLYTLHSQLYAGLYLAGNYHDYDNANFVTPFLKNMTLAQAQAILFGANPQNFGQSDVDANIVDLDEAHLAKMVVLYRKKATGPLMLGVYEHEGLGWVLQEALPAQAQLDHFHEYTLQTQLHESTLAIKLFLDGAVQPAATYEVTVSACSNQRTYGVICSGAAIAWNQVAPVVQMGRKQRPKNTGSSELVREKNNKIILAQMTSPKFGAFNLSPLSKQAILSGQYVYATSETDLKKLNPTNPIDFVVFGSNAPGVPPTFGMDPLSAVQSGYPVLISLINGTMYNAQAQTLGSVSNVLQGMQTVSGPLPAKLLEFIQTQQSAVSAKLQHVTFGSFDLDIADGAVISSGMYVYQCAQTLRSAQGQPIMDANSKKPMLDYVTCANFVNNQLTIGLPPTAGNANAMYSFVTGNVYAKTALVTQVRTVQPLNPSAYNVDAEFGNYAAQFGLQQNAPLYTVIYNAITAYQNYTPPTVKVGPAQAKVTRVLPAQASKGIKFPFKGFTMGLGLHAPGIHFNFATKHDFGQRQQDAAGNAKFQFGNLQIKTK